MSPAIIMEKAEAPEQVYVSVDGCWFLKWLVDSLIAQIVARALLLVKGHEYTLRQICGEEYWLCVISDEPNEAGRCVVRLCKAGLVLLIDTGKRNSENHHLYLVGYLPHIQSYRRNMESDLSFWKVHLLPKFGHKHLDELTPDEVVEAQQSMRKAGYAPGTANKYIVQIRYMYNVAKKAKIPGSEANPAAGIKQFRVEGRERFLSPEETERLRIAVERSDNKQLKYIVALALMLGCRKMELLKAKFEDFDLERRTWKIPLSKSGKTRHVPLSTASVAVLKSLPRWEGCPYVVPNPKTLKPFTHLNESWKTATRRAGLKGFRIHDLRHSFASNLVNAGHSLFVVSKALGHANIQQTSRYSHLSDDTLLAAADAAANAIGEKWTEGKKSPA